MLSFFLYNCLWPRSCRVQDLSMALPEVLALKIQTVHRVLISIAVISELLPLWICFSGHADNRWEQRRWQQHGKASVIAAEEGWPVRRKSGGVPDKETARQFGQSAEGETQSFCNFLKVWINMKKGDLITFFDTRILYFVCRLEELLALMFNRIFVFCT